MLSYLQDICTCKKVHEDANYSYNVGTNVTKTYHDCIVSFPWTY